jgi:response regulator RpfG family c-di-GMP phosphodiesterase
MVVSIIQIVVLLIAVVLVLYYIKQISRTALLFIILLFTLIGTTTFAPYISPIASTRSSEYVSSVVSIFVLVGVLYAIRASYESHITNEYFQSVQDIELSMLSGLAHKGVINTMLKRITETLHIDAAAIVLPHGHARRGCSVVPCRIEHDLQHFLEHQSNGFIMSVIETRTPICITSIKPGEQDEFLIHLRHQGFTSYLGAPVFLKGGLPAGVLTLFDRSPRRYTKREFALIRTVTNQMGIALDRAQLIDKIQEMNFESVRALVSAIESRDPYTRGHSIQVADLSVAVAREMDFSTRELTLLEFAGLLHDVGKIAVPEAILQKRTSLTDDEWKEIRQHSIISARIIGPISNLKPIQNWILYHHERFDGKGYPDKVKGKSIPLASRIMAVCDTYSAMTGNRPYRKALNHDAALEELRNVAGTQLDPSVVKIFTGLYGNDS